MTLLAIRSPFYSTQSSNRSQSNLPARKHPLILSPFLAMCGLFSPMQPSTRLIEMPSQTIAYSRLSASESNVGRSCDLDQNDIARRSFRRPSRTISSDARPLRQRRQHPDGSQPEPRSTTGSLRPL